MQRDISLNRLLWMGGIVLGASLPHWPTLPLWAPAMLASSVLWRIGSKTVGLPFPSRPVRYALAAAAVLAVAWEFRTLNGLNAGSALLVVMIALKFLESRSHRDQLVLMMISYFLVFAGLLYQRNFVSGTYVLAFVWVTTIGLLQLGRRGSLMRAWPTAKFAARLLLQATPVMVVLFLLFPRLPGPLWAMPGDLSSGATGLADTMSPGDITNLGLSDEVAFRVEFLDDPPPPNQLYWRGPVLSNFNGRTWSRREGMWQQAEKTLEFFSEPIHYRVMLEPSEHSWAFALEMPSLVSASRGLGLRMQSDYQLRAYAPRGFGTRLDYEVTSHTGYRANEVLDARQLEPYLALPPDFNPRTLAMMTAWKEESLDAHGLIARALDFFRTDEFFYTLAPPALGQHSIDEFLFETKEGFCEHYASAFAFMMRAAGIPSRVVTGYQGGELNYIGSYYIIRQSDAHAWSEVWLEGEGWVRVDPVGAVAPERIALGTSRTALSGNRGPGTALTRLSWARQLVLAWDAVNTYWTNWIVGYGPRLQRALLEKLGFDRPRFAGTFALAIGATIACLILLRVYLQWSSRTRHSPDAAEQCFARFMQRLKRVEIAPRAPTETPQAFAARAAGGLPSSAAKIRQIVATYLTARYEPDADGDNLASLEALVAEFKPMRNAT
jgi:transglutaminase-like putative cysteine protease